MTDRQKIIYVYADWSDKPPMMIGKLYADGGRGKEFFSFEYDTAWLAESDYSVILDPDLGMYNGRQYTPVDKALFGIFSDSCPDRWGRLLMRRREAILARKENRKPRKLDESDFLLGVYDESRMGALRFSIEEQGPFLSYDKALSTPPWATLRKLENASIAFERDESGLEEKWLNQLLAPGSSLGGARPKATVQAPDGSLWIAKFPSRHDDYNSGAWEMVAHELAKLCGLNVPEARLETLSQNGSTFLVKRFDRNRNQRIHFASAMTLLGKTDGASSADGTSYLDILSFIKSNGARPKDDLLELWKRIVFNMAISNTDDHLRNHAFILTSKGWILSPLYDVNPSIYGDALSLNVSLSDSTIDFGLALETAEYYEISKSTAEHLLLEIKNNVNENWKPIAQKYKLSRNAIEYMSPAFDMKFK